MSVTTTEIVPGMPQVGEQAPEVVLPDDTGAERDLANERGKWVVLYFYPKDDTPGCTTEACEFRDANADIAQRDAEVWGVSILGSGSKEAFKRKFGLPFTLFADENHEVAERYGTWVAEGELRAQILGRQALDFPGGSGRPDRTGFGQPSKPEGHAAQVVEALDQERAARGRAD